MALRLLKALPGYLISQTAAALGNTGEAAMTSARSLDGSTGQRRGRTGLQVLRNGNSVTSERHSQHHVTQRLEKDLLIRSASW
jgi:hypothetical protein